MVSLCSDRPPNSHSNQVLVCLGGFILLQPLPKFSSKNPRQLMGSPTKRTGKNLCRNLQRKSNRRPNKFCYHDMVRCYYLNAVIFAFALRVGVNLIFSATFIAILSFFEYKFSDARDIPQSNGMNWASSSFLASYTHKSSAMSHSQSPTHRSSISHASTSRCTTWTQPKPQSFPIQDSRSLHFKDPTFLSISIVSAPMQQNPGFILPKPWPPVNFLQDQMTGNYKVDGLNITTAPTDRVTANMFPTQSTTANPRKCSCLMSKRCPTITHTLSWHALLHRMRGTPGFRHGCLMNLESLDR